MLTLAVAVAVTEDRNTSFVHMLQANAGLAVAVAVTEDRNILAHGAKAATGSGGSPSR